MATNPARSSNPKTARAPPPTPIATGKGLRTAAVDDEVLAEYLDTSLKVPDLTLPHAYFPSRSTSPTKMSAEIDLSALAAGDEASVRWIVSAAAESGAFRIDGGDVVTSEEVRTAIEVGDSVFDSMAARRRGLVSRFDGGGIGEEICWHRSRRKEMEPVLEDVSPETYRTFRERMEVTAAKLEMVADCISHILCENLKDETHSRRPPKLQSVLYLRRRRQHLLGEIVANHGWETGARFLSVHLPIDDRMFRIHSSAVSATFSLPAGSFLVTIGEQLQEWCNEEYKACFGELLLNPMVDPDPLFSMEFVVFSLPESCPSSSSRKRALGVMDQLLGILLIAVLYNIWLRSEELKSLLLPEFKLQTSNSECSPCKLILVVVYDLKALVYVIHYKAEVKNRNMEGSGRKNASCFILLSGEVHNVGRWEPDNDITFTFISDPEVTGRLSGNAERCAFV
ncbi:hypothetical protein HPP92_022856 [Vanilla planifolia]|uniref:Uncharacterized protein n=1 Tax=Vanilla planifolia TaxID=51239 RepID=A0A835PQE7_VANPL|nr:hypothetical protein HPP92_022856 [Vanilla planifolia]